MQYTSFTGFISTLFYGTGLLFSIHPDSDIFTSKLTKLVPQYYLHASSFCVTAKSTPRGHNSCLKCKMLCMEKVKKCNTPFIGTCCYGLTEYVHPIFIDGKQMCTLFIGNILANRSETESRIIKRCKKTGVSPKKLMELLDSCVENVNMEIVKQYAKMIESYLCLLYEKAPPTDTRLHSAVSDAKNYADSFYATPVTLKDCAARLYVNEKYLGRLFKEQMGLSFHEYLNKVRLSHAKTLLQETSLSITAISYECGFSNVPYFNRIFKESLKRTPSEYRKKYKDNIKFQ